MLWTASYNKLQQQHHLKFALALKSEQIAVIVSNKWKDDKIYGIL